MDNTLILVDYDNVFVTLKNNYRDFRKPNIMYDVITKIKEHYAGDNILSCRLFADFQKVQISEDGYNILRKAHVEIEHVFNGKNASDVILMINCMKYMMQYPHIDKIVLVSSDSDLVPIFHEVKLLNKKLEVLYFEVNTGSNHILHMEETDIPHCSIEKLLDINPYQECADIESFYAYKTADKAYFTALLQKINDILRDEYDRYVKRDASGKIISLGFIKFSDLVDKMKENVLCPEREFAYNPINHFHGFTDMLNEKKIIKSYEFVNCGKKKNTILLSESYLTENGIIINNLLNGDDYKNDDDSKSPKNEA